MTTGKKPTLTEFFGLLIGDTTSLISGGLSVPFAVLSVFLGNKYAKVSFGLLSLMGFLIACYRLWATERLRTLAAQEALAAEIDKRGRPEITVELKEGNRGVLHVCLMNYASVAAINLRIDDVPCGLGVLRFENIPTMISSEFSPNLQCYFVPSDGSGNISDIVEELILARKPNDPGVTKHTISIWYTDSDGLLDWVTKCDLGYDPEQKKIVLLKQRIEEGAAEKAIRELRRYLQGGSSPDQNTIKWLRDAGYVEVLDATNIDSTHPEYLIKKITDKGERAVELEKIDIEESARRTEQEHKARMKVFTAPDSGIREFVALRRTRTHSTEAFSVNMLASEMATSKSDIEEALRILRSRGFAREAELPGHWIIKT